MSSSSSSDSSDDTDGEPSSSSRKSKRPKVVGYERSEIERRLAKAKGHNRGLQQQIRDLKTHQLHVEKLQQEQYAKLEAENQRLRDKEKEMTDRILAKFEAMEQRSNNQAVQGVDLLAKTTHKLLDTNKSMMMNAMVGVQTMQQLVPPVPVDFRNTQVWSSYTDQMLRKLQSATVEELTEAQGQVARETHSQQKQYEETTALVTADKMKTFSDEDRKKLEKHYVLCQALQAKGNLIKRLLHERFLTPSILVKSDKDEKEARNDALTLITLG